MPVTNRSPKRTNTEPAAQWFWQCVYFALTIGMVTMFLATLFPGVSIRLPLTLIIIALMVLTLKRWTGALFLALIQLHLFYFDPRATDRVSQTGSFLFVLVTVLLMLVVSRYRSIQELSRQSVLTSLRRLFEISSEPPRKETKLLWQNLLALLRQLAKAVFVITCCAMLAALLMSFVPLNPDANGFTIREYRLKPTGYRALMLGMMLFFLFLVVWLVVNELVWRTISKHQASVYLRSTFLNWIHRDLRLVVLRRLKLRRAKARRLEPASPPVDSSLTPLMNQIEE